MKRQQQNNTCFLRMYQNGHVFRAALNYVRNQGGIIKNLGKLLRIFITTFLPYFGIRPIAAPLYMIIDLNYDCNAKCVFCNRHKQQSKMGYLTLNELIELADKCKKKGLHQVVFAGGEPTLRKDLFAIIRAFHDQGINTSLCTNGSRLHEVADDLIMAGLDHVTVSLDGKPESHDKLRGFPGLFKKAERGIEHLIEKRGKDSKPSINVRMLTHEENIDEIEWFMQRWNGVADSCYVQPLHSSASNLFTCGGLKKIQSTEKLRGAMKRSGLQTNPYNKLMPVFLKNPEKFQRLPCYSHYFMSKIDPYGNVYGCTEQIQPFGNIREKCFLKIWKSEAYNAARRELNRNRQCSCYYNDIFFNTCVWAAHSKMPIMRSVIRSRFNGDLIPRRNALVGNNTIKEELLWPVQ